MALFPGLCHLQSLITCSVLIQRAKAREIWSQVVILQRVDTQKGVVAVINNVRFTLTCPQHPDQ